ncbi:BH0509 family protein [Staphylococcus epidermidis]|uniref:BH0509 family protein n=1 Tax=Staphylococcus epidermidis TaxID=1282 RepID=UPI003EE1E16E
MEKENLIALIDLMRGLDEDEYRRLNQKDEKEIKKIYINVFQEQDDEQIEISYL